MAGAACKVIINNGYAAAVAALERVLTSPLVRDVMLPAEKCNEYIQRMADIDIAAYRGGAVPKGGLVGIMKELALAGVFTDEIWEIFARPWTETGTSTRDTGHNKDE